MDGLMAFNSSAEMNAMAGNLASRSENTERSRTAYERALVRSDIAGFDVYKNDLNLRLAAATGGATTVSGADQRQTPARSEEHTSELQSLMRNSYAVFCLKKKKK